ncbi:hypothetical protein SEA_BAZZLE_59 [Mycobacterium phage Bazzle]
MPTKNLVSVLLNDGQKYDFVTKTLPMENASGSLTIMLNDSYLVYGSGRWLSYVVKEHNGES